MIDRLQRQLGYQFENVALLERALTHRSANNANNERLEFLGDAILGFEAADYLFQHIETATEGELSRMRSQLVKRETLASIARELNLGQLLYLGQGELRSGGQNRDSILADAVEAIIAAVYLDGGITVARQLVKRLLGDRLNNPTAVLQQKDAKTRLQEYLQGQKLGLPTYAVLAVQGNQHQQAFVVSCQVSDLSMTTEGTGTSRRKAEQQAAEAMLQQVDA